MVSWFVVSYTALAWKDEQRRRMDLQEICEYLPYEKQASLAKFLDEAGDVRLLIHYIVYSFFYSYIHLLFFIYTQFEMCPHSKIYCGSNKKKEKSSKKDDELYR